MNSNKKPISIYIHWPFCESKCPYCDFNSHTQEGVDQDRWGRALLADLKYFKTKTEMHIVTSIFFGGGTPSLIRPEIIQLIVQTVKKWWQVHSNLEVTLEANPSSSEIDKFQNYRIAGINRLSLGIQALNNSSLKFLGRKHTADEAVMAIEAGKKVFDRMSLDFIYALPQQTVKHWEKELAKILAIAGDHLSLYQLTIEPGTLFHKNKIKAASDPIAVELYQLTDVMTQEAGFKPYEISNYARSGNESRHNLTYWLGGEYIGIGPGAHGRLINKKVAAAMYQIYNPTRWLHQVEEHGNGIAKSQNLTTTERIQELFMLGLRVSDGINRNRFKKQTGYDLNDVINSKSLKTLIENGYICSDKTGIRASQKGKLYINTLVAQLAP